jgi:signal peptidase I
LYEITVLDKAPEGRAGRRPATTEEPGAVGSPVRRSPEDETEAGRSRPPRQRRVRLGRVVAGAVLAALIAAFALLAIGVGTGNWQVQPVLSGSMRPGFPVGGVVVAQRVPVSSLQVRDVILFHPPGEPDRTYVHRIISLERDGGAEVIRTQGDANRFPDSWTLHLVGRWAYVARFTVPLLGYAAVWDHSSSGHEDLLLAGGTLVALCGAVFLLSLTLGRRRGRLSPIPITTSEADVEAGLSPPGALRASELQPALRSPEADRRDPLGERRGPRRRPSVPT